MRKLLSILAGLLLLLSYNAAAQRGKNGNLLIGAPNVVKNEYTSLTANASTGNTSITVASNNLNANGRFSGPLAAGDLVMIIQMQGVSLNASPAGWDSNYSLPFDETWGAVTNLNNCGNYEFAEVYSVSGANTINLVCGLKYNYTSTGKVQVIRVPRFLSVTVNASSSITCDPWNGYTGGVVVVEVLNNVTINNTGGIHANERGFRGGLCSENISYTGTGQFSRNDPGEGAEKGEGVFGYQAEYNVLGGGMYCRGAAGNAGGGGNGHNSGGGGGGNAGDPALWTGMGNPDATGPSWGTAWNLESAGFATHTSTGGGRGGYSFSSANRNALTEGPGDTDWGGDNRRQVCGLGGRALDYSTGKIFMGGGGGAGDQNNEDGGQGGIGGGIVFILGFGSVTGAGSINSNGQAGFNASGGSPTISGVTGNDAAGGGGAGGTIIINAVGGVSGILLTANGGTGGNQNIQYGLTSTNQEAEGPGGGGGGGYIAISSGSPTRIASGGNNGTTNSRGMTEFTPNGATRGGAGNTSASISPTTLTVSNINACIGDDITITPTLGGYIYPGTQIVWYNSEVAGSVIHTGSSYTINNIASSTTIWVGFCPGWFRIPVTITVTGPTCVASADTTICSGNSANLIASGGTSYAWSPAGTLDNPNIANPVATPVTTTTYLVTAYDGVCTDIDSVTVTVSSVTATAGPDTTICAGQTVQLNALGGSGYAWNNGTSLSNTGISNPIASPIGSTTYTVTVSNALGCENTADVSITVNPLPNVNLGADTSICTGSPLVLDAGAGFTGYTWNPANVGQTFNVLSSGTYSVTVTDANSCQGNDDIVVNVVLLMDATITTADLDYCSNDGTVLFTATDPGGIWSGNGINSGGNFNPTLAGPGTHSITYTISGSCGDTNTVNVDVHAAPIVNLGPDQNLCSEDTVTLDAGSGYIVYNWLPAGNSQTIDVSSGGTYSVVVTDGNTCQGNDSIILTEIPQLDATITTTDLEYCNNEASVIFTATDPGGIWSGNGMDFSGLFAPSTVSPGIITITYGIAAECGDTATVDVEVFAAPVIDLGTNTEICNGDDYTLDAGSGYIQYDWTPSGNTQTITVNAAGNYSVTVTDANTCSGSAEIDMVVVEYADATIQPAGPLCLNAVAILLEGTDPGGIWSGTGITGSASGEFTPSNAGIGSHIITYAINSQCGDTATIEISVLDIPHLTTGKTDESCIGAEDGMAYVSISGGLAPYTILWSNSSVSDTIHNLMPDNYDITVTDANSCSQTSIITILGSTEECYTNHVYVPNVFSPNGDGQNDVLYVRGEGIEYLELSIFNRWGEKVFETTKQVNGWDGTYKGSLADATVYSFVLRITFLDGTEIDESGTITLVR